MLPRVALFIAGFLIGVLAVAIPGTYKLAYERVAVPKHYRQLCDTGIGQPYKQLMDHLQRLAASGRTEELQSVLQRADARSGEIYNVWQKDDAQIYRSQVSELVHQ